MSRHERAVEANELVTILRSRYGPLIEALYDPENQKKNGQINIARLERVTGQSNARIRRQLDEMRLYLSD